MGMSRILMGVGLAIVLLVQSGCGFGSNPGTTSVDTPPASEILDEIQYPNGDAPTSTVWDLFGARGDQGQIGAVNKYIWNASLDTLDFLPVQTVDPFTGVITTGFGTPPGGGRSYRATIHVSDPALDARSLNVALMTKSGPASAASVRAVEDAILTRARQLRAQDSRL
ncbi:DUF3576 domain-containing protein [Pelagimonas varians]|uniref:DUF3576 domain-containing protein n=1 Tax=Pelagimonas varians TaxID=696760 RepID=A0A238K5C5_9RHOB|nr:DUF3576 domain-containing protein [Pelagimonas varians]PYG30419.1 uncharacterized protein DUF3576 [Pelagimonas varians]SMX37677.1 hypothetical protein PEV8663_01163 [Pelagimonas varians]